MREDDRWLDRRDTASFLSSEMLLAHRIEVTPAQLLGEGEEEQKDKLSEAERAAEKMLKKIETVIQPKARKK